MNGPTWKFWLWRGEDWFFGPIVALCGAGAIFFFCLAIAIAVKAHSWYPQECCSENDCRPVPCEELYEQDDGGIKYNDLTFGDRIFSKEKIKPSQDRYCHVCIGLQAGTPYCVFVMQGS
jgi:hypothetical protein